ncbi:cip1-interacting zinc finger protein isoform X3 [Syngnathus scovelli]|uniref:cip1-interacting zinc finger protein isoform X3 n=1 Tax=Syngnathus scovelli TaxID=161590 RepID=UPI00211027DC|nr:cip1-interacting zinc finger protein isoform X3 [Syngnathus scovelli]
MSTAAMSTAGDEGADSRVDSRVGAARQSAAPERPPLFPSDDSSDGVCPPEPANAAGAGGSRHGYQTCPSASSLKVTIQRRGDGRAFKMAGERRADPGLRCHLCGVTCSTMPMFVEHMSSSDHVSKWEEMAHSVSVVTRALSNRRRRWCDTCQSDFSHDVISHRQTKRHKALKRVARPFCAACRRHFKTPRKFVEHMKSDKHKKVRAQKAQGQELITVDAIGCFEEEGGGAKQEMASEPAEDEAAARSLARSTDRWPA